MLPLFKFEMGMNDLSKLTPRARHAAFVEREKAQEAEVLKKLTTAKKAVAAAKKANAKAAKALGALNRATVGTRLGRFKVISEEKGRFTVQ